MKKSLSLLLVLALILGIFALVGCSGDDDENANAVSVAVIVSTTFGDLSFNDSAKAGGEALRADLDLDVEYIECNGENYKQQMMQAADTHDIVVPVGWEFYEITEAAKEYPDTKFIWVDNVVDGVEQYPNLLCITYAQNEGSFLAGYAAARMSATGVIGAVAGDDSATIADFLIGYEQGAAYADPSVKVETAYTNTFDDVQAGKQCAQGLAAKHADIIFQAAGRSGNGVFAAAKTGGFYAIGVDQDQKLSAKEYDDVIICSVVKKVGDSIYDVIKDYTEEDVWEGGRIWRADMATGYIDMAYGDAQSVQLISDDLKAELAELSKKIVAGEIEVETALG